MLELGRVIDLEQKKMLRVLLQPDENVTLDVVVIDSRRRSGRGEQS